VPNSVDSLDLYARIEDMLENREAIEGLYNTYAHFLSQRPFASLLDVGCGSGAFLQGIREYFEGVDVLGVDLSGEMVRRANARGVPAKAVDVCELEGQFDAVTAVFDMVNYLAPEALKSFFACIEARLAPGGRFLFDVNTRFGFEHVAVGAYIVEDDTRFLAIDSDFENDIYRADFTLFSKNEGCYTRESQRITQYYHPRKQLEKATSMQLVDAVDIELYGFGEPDKTIYIFEK